MADERQTVRHSAPGFACGWWRNVSIGAWGAAPSVDRLQYIRSQQDVLRARYPQGFAVVNVVRVNGSVQSLDAAARAESEAMIKHFASSILATATVLQGGGFIAAIARSVLAAQRIVARAKYPEKIFDQTADVSPWILPIVLGEPASPDSVRDLSLVIDTLSRTLDNPR